MPRYWVAQLQINYLKIRDTFSFTMLLYTKHFAMVRKISCFAVVIISVLYTHEAARLWCGYLRITFMFPILSLICDCFLFSLCIK